MLMQIQVLGGAALMLAFAFQMATGMRRPGLFGRKRLKVHTWMGWAVAAAALVHTALGFWLAYGG